MCQHLMKKVFQQMYHTAPEKASDALIADIQRAVVRLRESYRIRGTGAPCVSGYHEDAVRRAYMLAYYPSYVLPMQRVVRDYVVAELGGREALSLAFFSAGPCPEFYGALRALRGSHVDVPVRASLYDVEPAWREQQEFTAGLCAEELLLRHGQDELRRFARCHNERPCAACQKGGVCPTLRTADLLVLQNYLTHTRAEDALPALRERLAQVKRGAICAILDLSYAEPKKVLASLATEPPQGFRVLGTNLYDGPSIERRPFPMPPALRRVFTGQGMLQAKQVTQYFFLVLKKA